MTTRYIKVPMSLLKVMSPSNALVLSYIQYRLCFNVSFIESNIQIAEKVGMSECGVSKIMRKLKKEEFINSVCTRHDSIIIGSKRDESKQREIKKAYVRKVWLKKKGIDFYES